MNHIELGKTGEDRACKYLQEKGYTIVERNFKAAGFEIDVIVKLADLLVFVEVKSSSSDYFGDPAQAVNQQKEKHIMSAAEAFMEIYDAFTDIRFDIVSIVFKKDVMKIVHYEDAF